MSHYILFIAPKRSTLDNGGKTLETSDGTQYTYDVAVPYSNDAGRNSAIETYTKLRKCDIVVDGLASDDIAKWPTVTASQTTQRYHEPSSNVLQARPIMRAHM